MSDQPEPECANPLFLKWVGEWLDDATKRNSKMQYTLKKAHTSLQRYPLPLDNAQDAVQLQGIGQTIADRLAKKLTAWRRENNIPEPPSITASAGDPASETSRLQRSNSGTSTRVYIPRYRSGAFALIIGLLKTHCLYGQDYFVPKAELVPLCEKYTDTPFHAGGTQGRGRGHGDGGFVHTAWSAMKTLENKGLVERQSGVKFCLTEEGIEIAVKVIDVLRTRNELCAEDERIFAALDQPQRESARTDTDNGDENEPASETFASDNNWDTVFSSQQSMRMGDRDVGLLPPLPRTAATTGNRTTALAGGGAPSRLLSRNSSAQSMRSSSPVRQFSRQSSASAGEINLADLLLYPENEYDIILVVDSREVHSNADRSLITRELEDQQVMIEIRPLTVGDYLWIARAKKTGAIRNQPDIVLDYVVERKRMDDLCASIRDGRYKEQHSRIHGTGFTNVLYIVEGNDPEAVSRIGENAVNSAMSRLQIHHGFQLKRPMSFEATLRLLKQTTQVLEETLGDIYAVPDHLVGQKGFSSLKKNIQ
ncbi:Crossover junction endonuclease mus81, partial [Coemansia interrupta]